MTAINLIDQMSENTKLACDNCGWTGRPCDLDHDGWIDDPGQRMTPGCPVPAGECPECNCLTYPQKLETTFEVWTFSTDDNDGTRTHVFTSEKDADDAAMAWCKERIAEDDTQEFVHWTDAYENVDTMTDTCSVEKHSVTI